VTDEVTRVDAAKARAIAQFGATAENYAASRSHQQGDDLARMVELAQPRPTDRLLDIATGGANVARVFAPHVGSALATDLTPAMLAAAETALRARGIANVDFAEADAEDLPFPDRSFEIVTCRIAPHHFPRPDRFVAEVARVLTPGGRFLLVDSTVPAGDVGDFWNSFEEVRDASHVRSLTVDEWSALIHDAGLVVHVVEPYPKRHDFADWVGRAEVSEERRAELVAMLLSAPDWLRESLKVESDGETVVAFTDVKTLFFAVAPA
jgi:ubiquinone/menaquinone biosynthesis C-methylase UbiE